MRELFFIVFSLFMYVLLFAILGSFYFRESFEGVSYMQGIRDTNFELLILMTTANFPDVMLPAYNVHWTRTLFFIIFITLGLYFWLNLILASVFNIFKQRISLRDKVSREKRLIRIIDCMNKFSSTETDYLEYY